jgi:small subunit ribosomal protein S15
MFKIATRFFSTATPLFARGKPQKHKGRWSKLKTSQETVGDFKPRPGHFPRMNVRLGAYQPVPVRASKRSETKLRRKEKRMKRRIIRDVNTLKQYNIKNVPLQVDPVLGDPKCDFVPRIMKKVDNEELSLAYGIDRVEFEKLLYAAEKVALDQGAKTTESRKSILQREANKRSAILTVLHLRNTNAAERQKRAIKYAREELQRVPGDTGSPEVQAAVATIKIHFAMEQVKAFKKDKIAKEHVKQMVHDRKTILQYLKKQNPAKYYYTIAKIGLTDDAVVREFNMGKQYMQDYKVWGDKVLIKVTKTMAKKKEKLKQLQDRVDEYTKLAKRNYDILKSQKEKMKQKKA